MMMIVLMMLMTLILIVNDDDHMRQIMKIDFCDAADTHDDQNDIDAVHDDGDDP